MPGMNRHLLTMLFGALLATLLIGARLGYPWAGGTGVPGKPLEAVLLEAVGNPTADAAGETRSLSTGDRLKRGETLHAGDAGYLEIGINGARVGLDERTIVELTSLAPDDVRLHLLTGRLVVAGAPDVAGVSITTTSTESRILTQGALAVTYYNFRDTVDIVPINAPAEIFLADGQAFVATAPQEVVESPIMTVTKTTFDPTKGVAARFYARFGLPSTVDKNVKKP